MILHLFPHSEQPLTHWSGGSTRQLAIWPLNSDFTERDFTFRISTASVEIDHSTFTAFPGYKRVLMILEGSLMLHHESHYSRQLRPFEMDRFQGDWISTAEGKVRDFNIIYSDKIRNAHLKKTSLLKGESHLYSLEKKDFAGIYLLSGKLIVEEVELKEGDFVLLEKSFSEVILNVKAREDSVYLLLDLQCN